ncbi:MAG TPA: glycosyltransferase [Anaeromyxobacteraceae bacterium]|nr:glycosyltransferase [Anaeromyxobacteraceae bacterium]
MPRLASDLALLVPLAGLLLSSGFLVLLAVLSRRAQPPPYGDTGAIFRLRRDWPVRTGLDSGDASAVAAPGLCTVTRLRPPSRSRRYCLITPCRDEALYARRTLEAITRQTEPPALWVIVDDGSTDATPRILAEYAARFSYIRIVRRADRGARRVGGGVIDAFYSGYDTIDPSAFEYICKLDLDLDIPSRYFELMMNWMEAYPRIGTCSGKPYFSPDNDSAPAAFPLADTSGLVSEKCGDEQSVGMIKFYRSNCFHQVGGFVREVMWDGIDGHRCRTLGWIAISSDHPELRFLHLRPMGTSQKNWWTGRVRHGFGQYFMGTTPLYMLASAIYRMTRPPLLLGGLGMLYGYFRSLLRGAPRYGDTQFRRFLRSYQWACLLKGKTTATVELNGSMATSWRPASSVSPQAGVHQRIGEILVQASVLRIEKLAEALAAQHGKHAGTPLGEILVNMKAISQEQLFRAVALQLDARTGTAFPAEYVPHRLGFDARN